MQDDNSKREIAAALRELEAELPHCLLNERVRLQHRLRELRSGGGKWQARTGKISQELEKLRQRARSSRQLRQRRLDRIPEVSYPADLPITARKDEIRAAMQRHQVIIVAGETGSGKTTQLPKICLETGRGRDARIVCTQPRRVAALTLSRRLAEELNVTWGNEVGCKIRFRDQTSPETLIKLVTDGMLLSEIRGDPELLEYDAIILDEAHERSLNIDFLLGYLRLLLRRRPDLKLVITSATIDTGRFAQAFDGAPVIEVSGRVYPVEVRYWPLEEILGDDQDFSYIDGAVVAVEKLLAEYRRGDALVFMPGERDIREASELLESRLARREVEVLPLFSRLTAAEQQRVFSPRDRRRVIVSTNIAETSLTIPGIRFVVDTGLARVNRFNPRTRTQRLPVEAISKSSAEQRQGRCGRVAEGVCVRLYGEEDFLARPEYTAPEIQRADLAEVILRMFDLQLGEIEKFPFVDPPRPEAIHGGYQQLQELGALDDGRRLTRLGRDMARMPIGPTVSRMILQAQAEGALAEVLVIAAAVSIQDPRERPLERRDEADRMHRQFVDANSDFISLLNIWNAHCGRFEELKTQSQMRRFCRTHFLSFTRMREWRDIHAQLSEVLKELGGFRLQRADDRVAGYDAIHRSIATGLLSNIACKREHNLYRAARGRDVMIFPGSGLFERRAPRSGPNSGPNSGSGAGSEPKTTEPDAATGNTPAWIVAAEIVETSRLFARTVARIRETWLHGLQVASRRIPHQRVNPREATEVFIRDALIPGEVDTPHAFVAHNRQLRDRIEAWQTRMRRADAIDLDAQAYNFYAERLDEVSSVPDLNRVIRDRRDSGRYLQMEEADLLGDRAFDIDAEAFPDAIEVAGEEVPLAYAHRPGQDEDGVTVRLPFRLFDAVDADVLEWLVPGLREEKVTFLLRSLPKPVRKQLVPIPQTARRVASELRPTHPSFLESLEAHLAEHFKLRVRRADWKPEVVPDHLRLRVEILGRDGSGVAAGRDLGELSAQLESHDTPAESEAWQRAAARWERNGVTSWEFDDLPEQVEVTAVSGVPLLGYPGLSCARDAVNLRLFKRRHDAETASRAGLLQLHELVMKDRMRGLRRELDGLRDLAPLYHSYGSAAELQDEAYRCLLAHLFHCDPVLPLTCAAFDLSCERARTTWLGSPSVWYISLQQCSKPGATFSPASIPTRGSRMTWPACCPSGSSGGWSLDVCPERAAI